MEIYRQVLPEQKTWQQDASCPVAHIFLTLFDYLQVCHAEKRGINFVSSFCHKMSAVFVPSMAKEQVRDVRPIVYVVFGPVLDPIA